MNPKVDFFFNKDSKWQQEYAQLRNIVLDCNLTEELKWGCPCYTYDNRNVVLIHGFKEYCAILFFKGALLSNADGLLIQQTENVQSARQMRFTSLKQIVEQERLIKANLFEAIEVERAGLKVAMKETKAYTMPEEFAAALKANAQLKLAFQALTPGRQRAYLFYFAQPKQAKTRHARVEKYTKQILDGKGIDD